MSKNLKNTNTELCIDLKMVTRKPGLMPLGATLNGSLNHDLDYHYTFIETASERKC